MAARNRIPLREHRPNHLAMQRTLIYNYLFICMITDKSQTYKTMQDDVIKSLFSTNLPQIIFNNLKQIISNIDALNAMDANFS